jgi:lysophospholipase L1-like esterase
MTIDNPLIGHRIQCVGDSITVGTNSVNLGGYRAELIRSITGRLSVPPIDCGWSFNGVLGLSRITGAVSLRTDEIRIRTTNEAPAYKANSIFIIAGTNDTTQLANLGGPNSVNQSMTYLGQILDDYRNALSTCRVYLAKIPDHDTYPSEIITYNNALATMVAARSDVAYISVVDIYSALGLWSDTYFSDTTHPNAAGYSVIASTFYTSWLSNN